MSTPGDGRFGNLPVPAVAAFRDVADGVVDATRRWRDPSARLRRKKRRARRRAKIFGAASGMWGVGTATLVVASAPDWTVVATGGTTAALAVPAVLAVRRMRRLDAVPVPPAPPRRRALPPEGSVARAPMARLASNEQSLSHLLGVLARSEAVVTEDLDEIGDAARAASSALEAVAVDVVALESAARGALRPGSTRTGSRGGRGPSRYRCRSVRGVGGGSRTVCRGTGGQPAHDRARTTAGRVDLRLRSARRLGAVVAGHGPDPAAIPFLSSHGPSLPKSRAGVFRVRSMAQ